MSDPSWASPHSPSTLSEIRLEMGAFRRYAASFSSARERTFSYEIQDTSLSLREGLAEYYSSDPGLLAPSDISEDMAIGLRAHDASHVVFGCDTSVRGEVALARWSLFGAKGAATLYLSGIRSRETRFLFSDFFRKLRVSNIPHAAVDGLRALIRSFRMKTSWPSLKWEQYLDRPLADIRREFGIRVV